jgi:hypothetical protein
MLIFPSRALSHGAGSALVTLTRNRSALRRKDVKDRMTSALKKQLAVAIEALEKGLVIARSRFMSTLSMAGQGRNRRSSVWG